MRQALVLLAVLAILPAQEGKRRFRPDPPDMPAF